MGGTLLAKSNERGGVNEYLIEECVRYDLLLLHREEEHLRASLEPDAKDMAGGGTVCMVCRSCT